jgi:hypothetical protein
MVRANLVLYGMAVAVSKLPVLIVLVAVVNSNLFNVRIFEGTIVGLSTLHWLAARNRAKRAFFQAERGSYIAWLMNDQPPNHLVIAE